MVSSSITSDQIMSAVQRVPVERWGELLRVIESLQSCGRASDTQPAIRTGTDLKSCGLIGIWSDRSDLGADHEFARGLRREAERRG